MHCVSIQAKYFSIFFLFLQAMAFSGYSNQGKITLENDNIQFSENKGQWNEQVLYRLKFKTGALFLEKDQFTYTFINGEDWQKIYDHHHGIAADSQTIRGHSFRVRFENSNPKVTTAGQQPFPHYENYFLGQDETRWTSGVGVYGGVAYEEIYPNINMKINGQKGRLKYSFFVDPGGNPEDIQLKFEGLDDIFLKDGSLHYITSVNHIHEQKPYCYQEINGQRTEVPAKFILKENIVSFGFPDGYNPAYPLVIDPVLIFSTYTGSVADNFGYTATYDPQGNFYAGGIARNAGYPTTLGAFQTTFAGGLNIGQFDLGYDADISITKFNSNGTALIYSTYIGGLNNDQPHSLVVNHNNELLIYGRTNSTNYPVTTGAFDPSHNGKMDIIVTKMNSSGTGLTRSTYIGGSDDDGTNISPTPQISMSLKFNYADDARGEIIVDERDFVYVTSCTKSNNFPATAGAHQTTSGGLQDGCVMKLSPNLSSLVWATYLGGNGDDAGYSLVIDDQDQVYICGGTNSSNFATTAGAWMPNAPGGMADGFLTHLNTNGSAIINATYIGTNQYDQSYFVQLDGDNNVYVYGQTSGSYPVTAGVYSNPNSGQFITSLTPDLANVNFSTVFGRGDGNPDISPTAFLVDVCRSIYISGWGGSTNLNSSTTNNLPVTNDAFQSTTDGSDFYFLVLTSNAASLEYATYFGGNISSEHVDGGTSRFDKNGVIYQAVCAGCGGFDDFPTTPGSWSQQNNSFNCNLGAAKFEFQLIGVEVEVTASPATSGCAPFTVELSGNAINATEYFWDFGDGVTSTDIRPTHTYSDTGTYTVKLIGVDSTTCDGVIFIDSATVDLVVRDDSIGADFSENILSNCDSFEVEFINNSLNGIDYLWDFGDGSTSHLIHPNHEYSSAGTYNVSLIVKNIASCELVDTITRPITFSPIISAEIGASDSMGCTPLPITFLNTGSAASQFYWNFGDGNSSTSANPTHIFKDSGVYVIELVIVDSTSCNIVDTSFTRIEVIDDSTYTGFSIDTLVFECDSMVIRFNNESFNYTSLTWNFGDGNSSILENPVHTYTSSDSFTATLITRLQTICNRSDTASKTFYLPPPVTALFDVTEGCVPHVPLFTNNSQNATTYSWVLFDGSLSTDEIPSYNELDDGRYTTTLIAFNPLSCNKIDSYSSFFEVFNKPIAFFTHDSTSYQFNSPVKFHNQSIDAAISRWDFGDGNDAVNNSDVVTHRYLELEEFYPCLTVENIHGCDSTYCSALEIYFSGLIDVPTAFSPNRDGINDILFLRGIGVSWLEFKIYNRWGELVFETHDIDIVCNQLHNCNASKGWNGRYKGVDQEMDVYIYTLQAIYEDGTPTGLKKGNITLLR